MNFSNKVFVIGCGIGFLGVAISWFLVKPGLYIGWFGWGIAILGFIGSVWGIIRR